MSVIYKSEQIVFLYLSPTIPIDDSCVLYWYKLLDQKQINEKQSIAIIGGYYRPMKRINNSIYLVISDMVNTKYSLDEVKSALNKSSKMYMEEDIPKSIVNEYLDSVDGIKYYSSQMTGQFGFSTYNYEKTRTVIAYSKYVNNINVSNLQKSIESMTSGNISVIAIVDISDSDEVINCRCLVDKNEAFPANTDKSNIKLTDKITYLIHDCDKNITEQKEIESQVAEHFKFGLNYNEQESKIIPHHNLSKNYVYQLEEAFNVFNANKDRKKSIFRIKKS